MLELTPCFVSAKGYPTTHFDMDSVEAVGLVKMDILAQGGLAVMRDVISEVRNPKSEIRNPQPVPHSVRSLHDTGAPAASVLNAEPMLESLAIPAFGFRPSDFGFPSDFGASDFGFRISPSDPGVWEMIAGGNARAVHHIESPAMISLCKMCAVHDIDTLIAIVSVIRPGAANESKKMEFARRYLGLSPVRYPHPCLEPCLRSTYGLVVYEEHILQICEAFAGLPPGRADLLRRALGKEKTGLIAQLQAEFAECARRRGRTEAEIAEVWPLVEGFRGYAFCKAHSTAYGVEAYQSAWLKRYYPAQFMAAVLSHGKGFYHPLVYVLECHRLGISLSPPWVNEPGPQFTARERKIRVPLLRVKGLTRRTAQAILRERDRGEFSALPDFFLRVQPLPEEMEALIRVGAFDAFGQTRTTQYWEFKSLCASRFDPRPSPFALRPSVVDLPPSPSLQLWLFPPGNLDRMPSVPLAEPGRLERLRWEEELLGFPASGHPLELFPDIAWDTYCPVRRLGEHLGEQVVTCGLVIEQRLFHQTTGEPMKFLTLADWTGVVETELFARAYRACGLSTIRYRVLEISATVEPFESGRGYTLRVLRAGKPRKKSQATQQP
jgi:DNA polymerase III alpha subunit